MSWFRQFCSTVGGSAILLILLGIALGCPAYGDTKQQDKSAPQRTLHDEGAQIYSSQCVQCHGKDGQGTEEFYPDPLAGDLTIGELTTAITDTMPEEAPDECVAQQAHAVATFIHHQFYGEAAQLRNRPPRKTLSRLTGEQLRQSLADLYASMNNEGWQDDEQGLSGAYFNHKNWSKKKIKIERTDPVIDFDFGHEGPGAGINPKEYYIHWSGSLKAPMTGRYEMIVRSSCAFTLKFGHSERMLIDNFVQSAGKEEFRKTMVLTGGHASPVSIDFHQRKRKTELPPAKFSISWIPPWGVEEIVPARFWCPSHQPSSMSLQAKLPPDDHSYGYSRGTEISRQWDESTTAAAIEFASYANSELFPMYLHRHKKDSDKNRSKLRGFLTELVTNAFRRPLDEPLRKRYVHRFVDEVEDDAEAIKIVLLYALKSPRFLYPTLDTDQSKSRRVASRLTRTLFDSLPSDPWLRKMATKNQLDSSQGIEQAAWRMVDDPRCLAKTLAFLRHWFDLAELNEITKSPELYPGFDAVLVADLRQSFDRFAEDVLTSESSDFRQLLQADWGYTTQRMAKFYGDAWKPAKQTSGEETTLVRSASDSSQHVGLLNHPLLMSELAYQRTTSPIHRGVFLNRFILGRVLRPPNAAFAPISPDMHPGLTTRQRVQRQTGDVNCQVCHSKINPLGFSLEQFDAVGRYRETENGKTVDASGSYNDRTDQTTRFTGARELGDYLAGSPDCHRAFVESAFEHFVKQPVGAYGVDRLNDLTQSFQETDFSIKELIVSIAEIVAADLPPAPSSSDL